MIPDQNAFLALTRDIVADMMPDEQVAFDLASARIADELYRAGSLEATQGKSDEFQFIETATAVLNFVTLMVGTFEALRRLYKSFKKKPPTNAEVAESWRKELHAAGLPDATATAIVGKFEKDLANMLAAPAGPAGG